VMSVGRLRIYYVIEAGANLPTTINYQLPLHSLRLVRSSNRKMGIAISVLKMAR